MSGEDDYLITVMARDLADFERIHKEQLSRLPGVARLKSSFALRDVANKPLPASCLLPSPQMMAGSRLSSHDARIYTQTLQPLCGPSLQLSTPPSVC